MKLRTIFQRTAQKKRLGCLLASVIGSAWSLWAEADPQPPLLDADHFRGAIHCVAKQSDGRFLVGGGFKHVGRTDRLNLARLMPNGTVDARFNPGVQGQVDSLLLQPDGKILVGGNFVGIAGHSRHSLARLNSDGSLDLSFQTPDVLRGGLVRTMLLLKDGRMLIGGEFYPAGGRPTGLLCLQAGGSVDSSFQTSPAGLVESLVPAANGGIWVGGAFDKIGQQRTGSLVLLQADGSLSAIRPAVEGWVAHMQTLADGALLAGGRITSVAGKPTPRMVRLRPDGTLDPGFSLSSHGQDVRRFVVQRDGGILLALRDDGDVIRAIGSHFVRLRPNGQPDETYPVRSRFVVTDFHLAPDGRCLITGSFPDAGRLFDRCGGIALLAANGKPEEDFHPLGASKVVPTAKPADKLLLRAVTVGNLDHAKNALAIGADPNCVGGDGLTPLIHACKEGNIELVRLLLKSGADVSVRSTSSTGSSPLLFAIGLRHLAIAEALVEAGADVNQAGRDGQSPLCMASARGYRDGADWLLAKGARLDQFGNEDTVGVRHPPLTVALIGGQVLLAEFLLSKGASIESTNSNGDTPLRHLAMAPSADMAAFLLERGAAIDGRRASGVTALMLAALNGRMETVRLLIAKGANPTLKASRHKALQPGETGVEDAEALAARHGHEQVAELLRMAKRSFAPKR
jgi:uncharacterized delta-60 repeat protein